METKLAPFSGECACAKCGAGEATEVPAVPPGADTTQVPGFPPFRLTNSGMMHTRYCRGGKELENEEAENPMATIMKAATGALPEQFKSLGFVGPSKINICAGITEEHLHKICSVCAYEFLMQTKDVAAA